MFDTVLIGSGPPALMHGISLALRGERIAFIDRDASLGGAWRPAPAFGLEQIEIGVHLLENQQHVNEYIRALIGEDQVLVSDRDFGIFNRQRIPMRYFRIILYTLVFLKSACMLKVEKSIYALWRLYSSLQGISTEFVYPTAGFKQVLEALGKLLSEHNACFLFNENIHKIQIADHEVAILTDRNVYSARRVVMSSRANAPVEGYEDAWRLQRTVTIPNLLLRMEDAAPAFDGYVEFLGTGTLKRVRNVGALQIGHDNSVDTIIAAQLREVPTLSEVTELVEAARQQLSRLNLLSASTRVVDQVFQLHTYNEMPFKALNRISRRFPTQMHVLSTKDLSDEIHSVKVLENVMSR